MKYAWVMVLSLAVLVTVAVAAEKPSAKGATASAAPKTAEVDWVLQSKAMSSLMEFFYDIRQDANQHHALLVRYLQDKGQWGTYETAKIEVRDTPARRLDAIGWTDRLEDANVVFPDEKLTLDELISMAEEYLETEGYDPSVVSDPEEIERYKGMEKAQRWLLHKTGKALGHIFQEVMRMRAFLESTDGLTAFHAWAVREVRAEREAKLAKGREAHAARSAKKAEARKRFVTNSRRYKEAKYSSHRYK